MPDGWPLQEPAHWLVVLDLRRRISATASFLRDVMKMNMESKNFRIFSPDENNSNRWQDILEVTTRCYMADIYPTDDKLSPDGRVMEVVSEHQCQGWLEGYLLTGRHGFFSCYATKRPAVSLGFLGCLMFSGIGVMLFIWMMKDINKVSEREKSRPPNEKDAIIFAERFVTKQLKSPSTAKFPWGTGEYKVVSLGGGKLKVSGHVDAQNSFGAMIRSKWVVTLTVAPDHNSAHLEDIEIQ